MFLEIDIGNTRIKWRLREKTQIIDSQSSLTAGISDVGGLDKLFERVVLSSVEGIYIGSVVPSCQALLIDWCAKRFQCKPVFVEVVKRHGSVVNGYRDVSQMGVDRWLAILAAFKRAKQSCVIVDAGSAVTVDLLMADGVHCGGYIVPGLSLMNDALFRNTGRVKIAVDDYPSAPKAGGSTKEAVVSGLPLMLLGLVRQALLEIEAAGALTPKIIVTGGDGWYLANLLVVNGFQRVESVPELVLDGLQLAVEGFDDED